MIHGFKNALSIFRRAANDIPPYTALLHKKGIDPKSIKTPKDFLRLPITDKTSFILSNSWESFFKKRKMPSLIYASSGSSGQPTYWFSNSVLEEAGGNIHRMIYEKFYRIGKEEKTLVIVCFSMGVWVAGVKTMISSRIVAEQGFNLTVITPGIDSNNIISIIRDVVPQFDKVVLAGYPPFLMDLFAEMGKRRIYLGNNVRILTAGDKITEKWRFIVQDKFNLKKPEYIINLFGSSDASVMGFETPLSIYIRKTSLEQEKLYSSLFGAAKISPAIFQYNPEHIYLEEVDGELLITVDAPIPLIRYNIHDIVTVMPYKKMTNLLKEQHLYNNAKRQGYFRWKYPFVIVKGRTDVAVTYYSLNIYPENILLGLGKRTIQDLVTKNFLIYTRESSSGRYETLHIDVELLKKSVSSLKAKTIEQSIISSLIDSNIEFRKLHMSLGNAVLPEITLQSKGKFKHERRGVKTISYVAGKKPRVIV